MSPPAVEIITGFESTYVPAFDVDLTETTGHATRWRQDLDLVGSCGVSRLRYPIRWHRVEPEPGRFDWAATDEVLGYLAEREMRPIADLVHHTSYPRWLTRGFDDNRFRGAYLRYVEAFARRYPEVDSYTLFNEPFTTFLMSGMLGTWPPHLEGVRGFVRLAANVLPVVAEASRMCRDLLPGARHVYVDTAERHSAANRWARGFAALVNDRRFLLLDLFVGRPIEPGRPFVREVARVGRHGDELLAMDAGHVDVLGLDYYAHNQWQWHAPDRGRPNSPDPGTLASLFVEYWERYELPCILGETNIRGFASDRASWLKYTLEQCELAREAGVPVEACCWYPFVDSTDWDSLLTRADGHVDPVGVFWLDDRLQRRRSSMSRSFSGAAAGEPASALPAYTFQPPVSRWLEGWMPQMEHWDWRAPPAAEVRPPARDA